MDYWKFEPVLEYIQVAWNNWTVWICFTGVMARYTRKLAQAKIPVLYFTESNHTMRYMYVTLNQYLCVQRRIVDKVCIIYNILSSLLRIVLLVIENNFFLLSDPWPPQRVPPSGCCHHVPACVYVFVHLYAPCDHDNVINQARAMQLLQ